MKEPEQYDYIIVGAGILGCATAKYLKEQITEDKKVLLVDKYPACGQGNTSKSNACYRNVFDTQLNINLCNASIEYYKSVEKHYNLGLKEFGYLWLLTEDQMKKREEKNIKIPSSDKNYSLLDFLEEQRVKFKIFNQSELQKILPQLKIESSVNDDLIKISYGLLGYQCGSLSPDLLVKYYEQEYKNKKGECKYGYEVIDILLKEKGMDFDADYFPTVWRDTECSGIKVRNTKTLETEILLAKKVILCTGAWINQLLLKIGLHIGVNAKKRQLFRINNKRNFVFNSAFGTILDSIPFIILPSGGVFIKPIPENGSVDVGCSDDIGRRFELEPKFASEKTGIYKNNLDSPRGELDFYQTDVLPILQTFFPGEFNEKISVEHPSAGMYAYSLDKFPIITKELGNLYICTGASGSGIMKGDAIGRINVANILGNEECILFNGSKINVQDFGLHRRKVPQETLIL